MSNSRLPTEVELIYEVMPCNAMRSAQERVSDPHPCTYFRKWGTYHSFDYQEEGPPETGSIVQDAVYCGRAPLLPETLSGCRKAPIMSVGINPNLPGWWPSRHNSANPSFDSYKQYAHYFRYRAVSKLEIPQDEYRGYGGSRADRPLMVDAEGNVRASRFELDIPKDEDGRQPIELVERPQTMYVAYQDLLDGLAQKMGWDDHSLQVGEDLAYGNMVACPSAKWTTRRDSRNPLQPPMRREEMRGIVSECFHTRKYFLRQLFQSLPTVLLIFSNSTSRAFITEMRDNFIQGDPDPTTPISELNQGTYRLLYGEADGRQLTARVIFAPHITGRPEDYGPARDRVITQLMEEVVSGNLHYNAQSRHLQRPPGACVLCPMLEIGPCEYQDELAPLSSAPRLTAASSVEDIQEEKAVQARLLKSFQASGPDAMEMWETTLEIDDRPSEFEHDDPEDMP